MQRLEASSMYFFEPPRLTGLGEAQTITTHQFRFISSRVSQRYDIFENYFFRDKGPPGASQAEFGLLHNPAIRRISGHYVWFGTLPVAVIIQGTMSHRRRLMPYFCRSESQPVGDHSCSYPGRSLRICGTLRRWDLYCPITRAEVLRDDLLQLYASAAHFYIPGTSGPIACNQGGPKCR
jgi:hypothetical protein